MAVSENRVPVLPVPNSKQAMPFIRYRPVKLIIKLNRLNQSDISSGLPVMSATGHETSSSAAGDSRSAESGASNSRPSSRLPSRESSKQRSGPRSSSSPRSRSSSGDSSSALGGREMVGGCCVCADERGWDENPLVYCDGEGCNVAVHQGKMRG